MNSILRAASTSPGSFVAEIAGMIRIRSADKKLLVVVEGKTDKKVYKSLFDETKFDVYCSSRFGGCVRFEAAAKVINKKYPTRYIVIKDADFDNINRVSYDDIPNMFLTDTHDLETMMLTASTYAALKAKYGIERNIVCTAINEILHLSYLKWLNCKNDYRLNFKKCCKVGTCYKGDCAVEMSDWLESINKADVNSGKTEVKDEDLLKFEDTHAVSENEMLQITNGHDMLDAVAIKLRFILKKNVDKKDIEELFITSYKRADYEQTKLCRDINGWMITNVT